MTIAEKLFVNSVKNGLVYLKQPALNSSVRTFWNTLSRLTREAGDHGDVFLRTDLTGAAPKLSFFQRVMETLRFAWNKCFSTFEAVASKMRGTAKPAPTTEAAKVAAPVIGGTGAHAVAEAAESTATKVAGEVASGAGPATQAASETAETVTTQATKETSVAATLPEADIVVTGAVNALKPGKFLEDTTDLLSDFSKVDYAVGFNSGQIGKQWNEIASATHPDEALIQFLNKYKGTKLDRMACERLGMAHDTPIEDVLLPILEKHKLNHEKFGLDMTKLYKPATADLLERFGEQRIKAVANYKCGSDQNINQGLRLGKAESNTLGLIGHIDEAFEHSVPLAKDTVLYRGVKVRQNSEFAEKLNNLKAGDTFVDHAYVSTTSDAGLMKRFTNTQGYLLEIHTPQGTKCLDIEQFTKVPQFKQQAGNIIDESEFLLPRGAEFKVRSVTRAEGQPTRITMEYTGSTPQNLGVVDVSNPTAALDFTLEKLYRFPDEIGLGRRLFGQISQCAKAGRFDDVDKLMALVKDRAKYTQDPGALTGLVNPCMNGGWPDSSILYVFDKMGRPDKLIEELKWVEGATKMRMGSTVRECISALESAEMTLSDVTLTALREAKYIA